MKHSPLKRKAPLRAKKPMKKRRKKDRRTPEEKAYFEWLRTQNCVVTGASPYACEVERSHISRHRYGAGTAKKSQDWFAMPLLKHLHRELHRGDKTWEAKYGVQETHLLPVWERYGVEKIPENIRKLLEDELE